MRPRPEDLALVAQSALFDRDWYLREYPDAAALGMDAAEHYLRVGARLGRSPGPRFDARAYLETNPDVAARGENPLVHYLRQGADERRLLGARALSAVELAEPLDVIVPVFNAREDVERCLASIRRCHDGFAVRLIIVNDGSDLETTVWLRAQRSIELIEHTQNRGYTRAVNAGLRASSARYVVVLNSDTIVTPGWLTGLCRCLESAPEVGLAGPLSNAASWQNVPALYDEAGAFAINELPAGTSPDEMARIVAASSDRAYPRLPFLNGFCTMIRRAVIDAIGLLDEEAFPVGYGEENDYCIRAADAGFSLAVADDVYVFHAKSRSFGHERRAELTRQGAAALKAKHSPAKVQALVAEVCRTAALDRVRARVAHALRPSPTPSDGPRLDGLRLLFLLPVKGGGGGAHSVVQEATEMRRLGVDARVAVEQLRLDRFLAQYADLPAARELFIGFDGDEICDVADSFDVVVATFFASIELLAEIARRSPHVLPGYYVQDYEPLFYPEGSSDWQRARASYGRVRGAVLFAKTSWLVRRVSAEHDLRVHKVEPSIDHGIYRPEPRTPDGQLHVVAMVRPQTPYRGPARTMRVLERLASSCPKGTAFHIFGCDRGPGALEGLAQGFRYHNHGVLTRPQVAELLASADLFVDLSDYQAFGRTALEAMACGCAAAVPRHGGTDEYAVDGVNALVLDPFDEDSCVARLTALLSAPARLHAMQIEALRTAARFSVHRAAVSELVLLGGELRRHRAMHPELREARLLLRPARSERGEITRSSYVRLRHAYRSAAVRRRWRVDECASDALPAAGSAELLVVQRIASSFEAARIDEWLRTWRSAGGRLLFDADESILEPQAPPPVAQPDGRSMLDEQVRWLAANADLTVAATDAIAERLRAYTDRVRVVPSRLRASLWGLSADEPVPPPRPPREESAAVRIGFVGLPSHYGDVALVGAAMARLERELRGAVHFEVVGTFAKSEALFGEAVGLPKRRDYPSVVRWLLSRPRWDIAILPSGLDPKSPPRCRLDFLELAALDVAIVCSNVSAFRDVAVDGETALVVADDPEGWYWAVRRLVRERALRQELGRRARELVARDWTIERRGDDLARALGEPPREPAQRAQRAAGKRLDRVAGQISGEGPVELTSASWPAASEVLLGVRRRLIPRWIRENEACCPQDGAAPARAGVRLGVMVGTLCSGENELESCRAAIAGQKYPKIEHVVISGLKNMEAHDKLYRSFLESDADLLLKIDADMVVLDNDFVRRVVEVCAALPELAMLQMAILDFYSGGEIQGVNAYTKRMAWSKDRQDVLFTDMTATDPARRKVVWATFGRSVVHSPNPTPFQAYHFGVHRALKVLRALEQGAVGRAREQMMYLERTSQHYQMRRTRNLLCACLGAEHAFRGGFRPEHLDYDNSALRDRFAELEALPTAELAAMTERLRAEETGHGALDALRAVRERIAERPTLRRLLLLLPHLGLYGGVHRMLEIACHAERQGVQATVAVRVLDPRELERVEGAFPGVRVTTLEQAHAQPWDAVLCGDYTSGLVTMLPWFDSALSVVYLLNGWQHRHINQVQMTLADPDLVLANSSYAAEQYPGLAPFVVAGGVDLDVFGPGNGPRPPRAERYRVGVPCGGDRPRKRLSDAIAACERVASRGVPIELHLLNAEPIAIESPLPRVYHVGLGRSEVASLLRSVDAFLCPEEDAGWNNPAAEAMACGAPVVCTRAGTTDFAIDGETALVVTARDVDGFGAALERLLGDDELSARLRTAAAHRMRAFSWAALTRNLIEAVESARPDRERRAAANRRARQRIVETVKRARRG